jgi:recombination protein RecA
MITRHQQVRDVLDLGTNMGIIDKRGAFFRYNNTIIGQGRENAKQFLRENPGVAYEIETAIRQNSESLPTGALSGANGNEEEATPAGSYEE